MTKDDRSEDLAEAIELCEQHGFAKDSNLIGLLFIGRQIERSMEYITDEMEKITGQLNEIDRSLMSS